MGSEVAVAKQRVCFWMLQMFDQVIAVSANHVPYEPSEAEMESIASNVVPPSPFPVGGPQPAPIGLSVTETGRPREPTVACRACLRTEARGEQKKPDTSTFTHCRTTTSIANLCIEMFHVLVYRFIDENSLVLSYCDAMKM